MTKRNTLKNCCLHIDSLDNQECLKRIFARSRPIRIERDQRDLIYKIDQPNKKSSIFIYTGR